MTAQCRELQVGDRVRIQKAALDFMSRKRGWHELEFEVLVVLPNDWVRLQDPRPRRGTTLWPGRMLRRVG